jgi:hypothetical protein
LVLSRRAETKLVRIPVESDRRQRRRD